ncbi:MAG: sugar phosphorylase [Lentisphaerota bacterium]
MKLTETRKASIFEKLNFIFRNDAGKVDKIFNGILKIVGSFPKNRDEAKSPWISENDAFLITYGDSLLEDGISPLKTLNTFAECYLKGIINYIHILPFYPWTSDDGFSVSDYFAVDRNLGDWSDVERIARNFKIMFDAVVNHISAKSEWFQGFLNGDEKYDNYFIISEWLDELKKVTRPRTHPLLTDFQTRKGVKKVWTTFSDDQIDLNFCEAEVFLKVIELLLFYASKGASAIRLDAIGYIWKEIGTNCIHQPEAHKIIQVWRDILEEIAPDVILISETNVPHKDNISYFGNGKNEVKMVYQFPLPPLVVHTLQTGNAEALLKWASGLDKVSESTTFFNFLSSHDGIGVIPATGLLSKDEIDSMVKKVEQHKGLISYKTNPDGSQSPYEMNINYLEAISRPDEGIELRAKKMLSAQFILLSFIGVPAIYIHSLLGSLNDFEGLKKTGRNRSINREKLNYAKLCEDLQNQDTLRSKVFAGIKKLLEIRKKHKAFSPLAEQIILNIHPSVFSIVRCCSDEEITVLGNISGNEVALLNLNFRGQDLISGKSVQSRVKLRPYEFMWIKNN